MDNLFWLEGSGEHNGYFEIAFLPHAATQKIVSYLHNGKSNIAYDLGNEKKDFAILDSCNFSKQTACMVEKYAPHRKLRPNLRLKDR